jgi:hypothetical protein
MQDYHHSYTLDDYQYGVILCLYNILVYTMDLQPFYVKGHTGYCGLVRGLRMDK